MSATNSTTHYNLPSFIASDKPAWLVDWNGAMASIDAAIYEAKQTADAASGDISAISADLTTLASTVSTQGNDITTLTSSLTSLVGTVNTITSLIGNGTPTTTDKTIIGAINEINAKIPSGGGTAADVSYDNTTSGLTANNVQGAIDEMQGEIASIEPVNTARKIIFMADSWGDYTPAGGTKLSWTESVIERLTARYGATNLINITTGSRGFAYNPSVGTFEDGLRAYVDTDPDAITDIIVLAGTNDVAGIVNSAVTASDIKTAIASFVSYAQGRFKNADIQIGFLGAYAGQSTAVINCVEAYKSGALESGAAYVDNCECIMLQQRKIDTTGVHPTAAAMDHIVNFVTNYVLTHNMEVTYNEWNVPVTAASGVTITPPVFLKYSQRNNILFGILYNFGSVIAVTGATAGVQDITFGTVDSSVFPLTDSSRFDIKNVPVKVTFTDTSEVAGAALIRFEGTNAIIKLGTIPGVLTKTVASITINRASCAEYCQF